MRPIFIVFTSFQHNPLCAFERREDAVAQIDKFHEKHPDAVFFFQESTLIWNVPDCLYNDVTDGIK